MSFHTADLCDQYSHIDHFQIAEPIFHSYGAKPAFCGQITTLKVFEDNVLLREILSEKQENTSTKRVLVVDGGGSERCALLGDNLVRLACDNGWQGLIVYGCIRDSAAVNRLPVGIRALHTHPLKSHKRGYGEKDTSITFAGVHFKTGYYIYADEDGILVVPDALT